MSDSVSRDDISRALEEWETAERPQRWGTREQTLHTYFQRLRRERITTRRQPSAPKPTEKKP